jgi:uncharacterized protein YcbK (DUF882 family)
MNWEYFSEDELKCKCGCGKSDMDPEFMRKLIRLRRYLEFPFPVTSAYRCPEYNQRVSSTGPNGPHTTGRAIDIGVSGGRAYMLASAARSFGFTGIGLKQHGRHEGRFVHLDDLGKSITRPRPWIWTYGHNN